MLVLTLVLAGVAFAMLVVSLTTGAVIWAWGCIGICAIGGLLLLGSALFVRQRQDPTPQPLPEPIARGKHSRSD